METEDASSVEAYTRRLQLPVSSERYLSYRDSVNSAREALIAYFWNIALCESLYPCLNAAEIGLRNSIYAAFSDQLGDDNWLTRSHLLLDSEVQRVNEATSHLYNRQKPTNPGRIVAQLNFGFWVALLQRPYETLIWRPQGFNLLQTVFPHLPRRHRTRSYVFQRFREINSLRNRVFHYEPVWNYRDLWQEHLKVTEAIGWISPELQETIRRIDRFPDVYLNGWRRIDTEIKDQLGLAN